MLRKIGDNLDITSYDSLEHVTTVVRIVQVYEIHKKMLNINKTLC